MMKRRCGLLALLAVVAAFFAAPAMAACTAPPGADSATRYDHALHKMFVCNDTTWLEIPGGAGGGVGCALDGVQVPSGASFDFYSAQSHADCTSVRLSRTCTAGTLSGGASYQYASCTNADTTPNAFSFTDQTGAALSTVTNSNIIQIAGLTGASPISLTGTGFYRVCADATCSANPGWQATGTPGNITNNQYIQVRVTSSASNNTAVTLVVNIGGVSDTWSVTTVAGCGGTSYGGYCWYMGTAGQSCDTVCSTHSGCNSTGTINYAGSSGNITNCRNVLDALGVLSFPDPPHNAAASNAGGNAVGCSSGTNTQDYWIFAPPTTTCAASYASSLRACACNG